MWSRGGYTLIMCPSVWSPPAFMTVHKTLQVYAEMAVFPKRTKTATTTTTKQTCACMCDKQHSAGLHPVGPRPSLLYE